MAAAGDDIIGLRYTSLRESHLYESADFEITPTTLKEEPKKSKHPRPITGDYVNVDSIPQISKAPLKRPVTGEYIGIDSIPRYIPSPEPQPVQRETTSTQTVWDDESSITTAPSPTTPLHDSMGYAIVSQDKKIAKKKRNNVLSERISHVYQTLRNPRVIHKRGNSRLPCCCTVFGVMVLLLVGLAGGLGWYIHLTGTDLFGMNSEKYYTLYILIFYCHVLIH